MSTKTNCPQSPLSGFQPKPETVQDWMDKLTANGITDGVLCRLIHGRDEGKIVKFENYTVNDLGVCIEGGYFLLQDETLKVAEPLFVPLLELSEDVKFFGYFNSYEKAMFMKNSVNQLFSEIIQDGVLLDTVFSNGSIQRRLISWGGQFIKFRTAQDLFAWMALND